MHDVLPHISAFYLITHPSVCVYIYLYCTALTIVLRLLTTATEQSSWGTNSILNPMFTRACHQSLTRAGWIQSAPTHPVSLRSILILSYHLQLTLLSGLFPLNLPTKMCCAFLIFMHCTCPVHLILLDLWCKQNRRTPKTVYISSAYTPVNPMWNDWILNFVKCLCNNFIPVNSSCIIGWLLSH